MTYYHNNIAHMLVMPSLLAALVTRHRHLSQQVLRHVETLIRSSRPASCSCAGEKAELAGVVDALIAEMLRQGADRRRWRCREPQPVPLAPCSCWPLAPRDAAAMPSPSGC
ncbi:hypothetical protein MJ561_02270 [Klebsiella pneumoniae]|nr:hypothetical protein MJ561_02270 [Klebsiella pneumoniae]